MKKLKSKNKSDVFLAMRLLMALLVLIFVCELWITYFTLKLEIHSVIEKGGV